MRRMETKGCPARAIMGGVKLDLDAFVRDGYVAVRGAVDPETLAACRESIWAAMERRGVRPDDPSSWPTLVEGMDDVGPALLGAYLSPTLTAAYDELVGPGRWKRSVRPADLGASVIVRFPAENRGNAGYHIEGSYRGPDGRYWANVRSRARGLLALILFTDVGRQDAPTRLLCGSHLAVPEFLAPFGEEGTGTDPDVDARLWRPSTLCLNVAHATGKAGDVFLCHPFIVHTATWPHRGDGPRMIAQPAVNAPDGFELDGSDSSPVARAIVKGLALAD